MKSFMKPLIVTAIVVVVLVVSGIIWWNLSRPAPVDAGPPQLVRDNSQILDDGGAGSVTVVEFLDFECEACGAAYPYVEDLRAQYKGDITYVVRYFPLPGHFNSKNAALAAEAASMQGKFEDMYHALFASQAQWGEAQESRADVFRTLAEDIGLDMTAYDQDVAAPATLERVEFDLAEGRSLGVSSTPTFFVNDELLELSSWSDLTGAIDAELSR